MVTVLAAQNPVCGVKLSPLFRSQEFPFLLIKTTRKIILVNYKNGEVRDLFDCPSEGLLNQKLVRIHNNEDTAFKETYLTTQGSVLVRFTIDKSKLIAKFNKN